MTTLRKLSSVPAALLLPMVVWTLFGMVFSHSSYGLGFIHSVVGLTPQVSRTAVPTAACVVIGTALWPSSGRIVAFVFFAVALFVSPAGQMDMWVAAQHGVIGFWAASAGGLIVGGLSGLALSLWMQRKRREAEPGATDNPDDAQRLREDH